jgi:hypothetical protein
MRTRCSRAQPARISGAWSARNHSQQPCHYASGFEDDGKIVLRNMRGELGCYSCRADTNRLTLLLDKSTP